MPTPSGRPQASRTFFIIRKYETEYQISRFCAMYVLDYPKLNRVLFFTPNTTKARSYLSIKHLLNENSGLQLPISISTLYCESKTNDTLP